MKTLGIGFEEFLGNDDLRWNEPMNELLNIIEASFGHQKFARRNIEKGNTTVLLSKLYSREVIAVAVIEDFIVEGNTGCDQLCNPPFYDLLGQFGVFQLIADSNPLSG